MRPDPYRHDMDKAGVDQATPVTTDPSATRKAKPTDRGARDDTGPAASHFERSAELACHGQILEAARQFQAADLQRPDHPAILINLGLLMPEFGQPDGALSCIGRACTLRPGDAAAALALATELYRRGDTGAAVPAHQCTVALAPRNPVAWTALGDCLKAVDRFDKAIGSLREALAVDPNLLATQRSSVAYGPQRTTAIDIGRISARLDRADLPINNRITAGFALPDGI
jgi:eukaryotic-like serine/threonine-protein kinase